LLSTPGLLTSSGITAEAERMAQHEAGCRVTVANTGEGFVCPPGELILDAGLAAGIALPHNCRGGACGTCKARVVEGEVDHGWGLSFALADEEKAAGKCLICQSRALSPTLTLEMDGAMAPGEEAPPPAIETVARVLASEPLTPSVRRLAIALPPGVRFRYRAGMHVEIRAPGLRRPRTYSIATAPDEQGLPPDGLIELFVARHPGGRASGWLHAPERLGEELALRGPSGTFRLPDGATGPVLCLAGGTGLAPILAIVRSALAAGRREPIRLIHSVRGRSEIFAQDALHALARRPGRFSYALTLSREAGIVSATGWRAGRIPDWLPAEMPDLGRHWVLAAGPPGFVDAVVAMAGGLGAAPDRILTDRFTPLPPT
jgi:CDP-4-dehydro-6-deoxyglucose reductase, E3